ncbi:Signal transduction histidine kinase [Marinospirillum celere]|uniref:histidine kinase n=1 Tax=Marinospirillum celere TaxID=1122252 RepID=A0A1I1G201_9GAMM|nr:7TM-DISM domain-containing protein [Marinospirillum celere]SFC05541.1 Signal transduction histidine kinase [Marinospirillum celere]
MARLLLLIVMLLVSAGLQAAPEFKIEQRHFYGQGYGQLLDYYQDTEGKMDLAEIRALPDGAWQRQASGNLGFNEAAHWYRFQLTGPLAEENPWFLVAPFILLDQVSVYWVDEQGQVTEQHSGLYQPLDKRPDWQKRFAFPFQLPENASLTTYVRIQTEGLANTLLLHWMADDLYRFNATESRWLSWFYGIIGGLGLFFAIIFLVLRDRMFLYFGGLVLTVLILSLANAGEFVANAWLSRWPQAVKLMIVFWPLVTTAASLLFLSAFFNLRLWAPRLVKVFYGYLVLMLPAALLAIVDYTQGYRLTMLLAWMATPMTLAIIILAWHRRFRPAGLILIGILCSMLGAGIDISRALTTALQPLLLGEWGFSAFFISRNGILVGMTAQVIFFALAVAQKIYLDRYEYEQTLKKLVASEEEKRRLVQNNSQERERLMREMHDGLGSQLTATLYAARREEVDKNQLQDQLEVVLNDLRLMMDSLQPEGMDLATLLGQLRYRLGQRMQAAGLKLNWQVQDLPMEKELTPQQALNFQRLIQEALTNIIKHAEVKEATLTAETDDYGNLIIRICDRGKGLSRDPSPGGRGLANMHQRAYELGAHLNIYNNPEGQGCCVQLKLPAWRAGQAL